MGEQRERLLKLANDYIVVYGKYYEKMTIDGLVEFAIVVEDEQKFLVAAEARREALRDFKELLRKDSKNEHMKDYIFRLIEQLGDSDE